MLNKIFGNKPPKGEAEVKVKTIEDELIEMRALVKQHREAAVKLEQALRSKEAEFRHARRMANAERGKE